MIPVFLVDLLCSDSYGSRLSALSAVLGVSAFVLSADRSLEELPLHPSSQKLSDPKAPMSDSSQDEFKVVVVGQPQVGKTSLVQKFVSGKFYHQVPQLPDKEKKTVTLQSGKTVNLNIFDLADQTKVDVLTKEFSNIVIYVYNVMDKQTFYDVSMWIRDLEIYLTQELHKKLPILFVGNKKDLRLKARAGKTQPQQQEEPEDDDEPSHATTPIFLKAVKQFIEEHKQKNYNFLEPKECSSLNGEGVEDVFVSLVVALAGILPSERINLRCVLL